MWLRVVPILAKSRHILANSMCGNDGIPARCSLQLCGESREHIPRCTDAKGMSRAHDEIQTGKETEEREIAHSTTVGETAQDATLITLRKQLNHNNGILQ